VVLVYSSLNGELVMRACLSLKDRTEIAVLEFISGVVAITLPADYVNVVPADLAGWPLDGINL